MEKVIAIAQTTYRESIRGKVLYTLLFFGVLVVLLASFFGSVTIGEQSKVVKDLGLFSLSFFSVAYAVIAGAALLHKELARKTVYNLLSKPVERWEFVIGKYLGMVATLTVMVVLMGAAFSLYTSFIGNGFDRGLLYAYWYTVLEVVIVCAVSIFFSSVVVTPLLSGLFTFAVFVAGRSVEFIRVFTETENVAEPAKMILRGVYWGLPHLNELSIANGVVYGTVPAPSHLVYSSLYAVTYAAALLTVAVMIFRRREFN